MKENQRYFFIGTSKSLEKIHLIFRVSKSVWRQAILPKPQILQYLERIASENKSCIFGFRYNKSRKALIFEKTLLRKRIKLSECPHTKYFHTASISEFHLATNDAILHYIRYRGYAGGTFVYNSVNHKFYIVEVHGEAEIRNRYNKKDKGQYNV